MSIIGKPALHVALDRTDRVGIRSLVLWRMWQASRGDFSIDERDAEAPATPAAPSGMEYIGRDNREIQGHIRTYWTYTGVHSDRKNVSFKNRGNSPDYQFEAGFSQVPAATHPKLGGLFRKYEGYFQDGAVHFPLEYDNGKKNPMFGFGQAGYLRIQGTYTYRYCVQSLREVPQIEGKIFEANGIPGEARDVKGCNYLCAGTPYQRHGPVYEVMETYWLSGLGGWPRPVYVGTIDASVADNGSASNVAAAFSNFSTTAG